MTRSPRLRITDWRDCIITGALLGLLVLGIGGRIAMRVIAVTQGQPGGFSFGGSMTVVMLGAGAGAVVAAVFLLVRLLLPRQRVARGILFWGIVGAFVLRGLNPVSPLNLAVFAPLFILHGGMLTAWWCRIHLRRTGVAPLSPVI